MMRLDAKVNLVICQKSKIDDWVQHFRTYYGCDMDVFDLTGKHQIEWFFDHLKYESLSRVGIINYDLVFRRPELLKLKDFTLMLDESSLVQNEQAKRSKFVLKMNPKNIILLSGTPTGGKYENLWSQLHLLGWQITKQNYWNSYIQYHFEDYGGFPVKMVDGYKNVDHLKRKMREYGCHFLTTNEVMDLPDQIFTSVNVQATKEYKKFRKDRVVTVDDTQLVGDNTLTAMLYERQLCGQYNQDKLCAFKDLLDSTSDRLIVFYNFNDELAKMMDLVSNRPVSIINGKTKTLTNYDKFDDSITFVQYQAGAMGLNLQKANKIIYFTPPLSSELYEQSKKRINRIGQNRTCYYYNLTVKGSVEEHIYKTLAMRKDFTEELFKNV